MKATPGGNESKLSVPAIPTSLGPQISSIHAGTGNAPCRLGAGANPGTKNSVTTADRTIAARQGDERRVSRHAITHGTRPIKKTDRSPIVQTRVSSSTGIPAEGARQRMNWMPRMIMYSGSR